MPLTAYQPLAGVYAFHEQAERWILRRYLPGVAEADGAERTRPAWSESIVNVFPDRTAKTTAVTSAGQTSPATCTIYTRTAITTTDSDGPSVQSCDVLFDHKGRAWQATKSGDWDEAKGYAVTLTQRGARGTAPWV
jgi:hypothetical protein